MYSLSDDEFKKIVNESTRYKEVYKKIGYRNSAASTKKLFDKRCKELNISIDHFELPKARVVRTFENVFCKDSTADKETVKLWYTRGNYSKYKCAICGMDPEWNGQPLTLRLDHINGTNNDNRLENLRWVCPNCDSQLPTYCGRNLNKKHQTKNHCVDCGKELSDYKSKRCLECSKLHSRKVERPSREKLKNLIRNNSFLALGKEYGVSDNAIKKWCKSYDLPYKRSDIKLISDEDWSKL